LCIKEGAIIYQATFMEATFSMKNAADFQARAILKIRRRGDNQLTEGFFWDQAKGIIIFPP